MHRDGTCRTQQQQIDDDGSANRTAQTSDYPGVFTANDPPPGSKIEGQGISFSVVEVLTRDDPTKEQSFWSFGPTDEPLALFDTSGLFSGFGDATSEETGILTFDIKEGPVQELGLLNHTIGELAAIIELFETFFLT